jgi:hypothetical protein
MHCRSLPAQDKCGVDLISDALSFGRLWYGEPNAASNAIGYAQFYSRSHDAVIRVYDDPDGVIETHEHANDSNKHAALTEFGQLGDSKLSTFLTVSALFYTFWIFTVAADFLKLNGVKHKQHLASGGMFDAD